MQASQAPQPTATQFIAAAMKFDRNTDRKLDADEMENVAVEVLGGRRASWALDSLDGVSGSGYLGRLGKGDDEEGANAEEGYDDGRAMEQWAWFGRNDGENDSALKMAEDARAGRRGLDKNKA